MVEGYQTQFLAVTYSNCWFCKSVQIITAITVSKSPVHRISVNTIHTVSTIALGTL